MQDDRVCPQEGHEPYTPTEEEIKDAVEQFDVLTNPHYDDDYVEMHSQGYRSYIRVFKWFKEEHDRYKDCANRCLKLESILKERIKWLEIENENLQTEISEMRL